MINSLVLPVFNCSPAFERGMDELMHRLAGRSMEIIVVDDGSADQERIREICERHSVRFIGLERNSGKGFAVGNGVMEAAGGKIVFMDGDFPFELGAIDRIIAALDHCDIAIGDRRHPDSSYPHNISPGRKIASTLLAAMIRQKGISDIQDTQCGIKGFRRRAARELFPLLRENKFSFDIELLFLAQQKKMTISQVPVTVRQQQGSSVKLWRDGLDMARLVFRLARQKNRKR